MKAKPTPYGAIMHRMAGKDMRPGEEDQNPL